MLFNWLLTWVIRRLIQREYVDQIGQYEMYYGLRATWSDNESSRVDGVIRECVEYRLKRVVDKVWVVHA